MSESAELLIFPRTAAEAGGWGSVALKLSGPSPRRETAVLFQLLRGKQVSASQHPSEEHECIFPITKPGVYTGLVWTSTGACYRSNVITIPRGMFP